MSSGVSQIKYWREGDESEKNNHTNSGGSEAVYLSYDVLLGLTIFGGAIGLDHLYARSLWTWIAKIIVNVCFFGVWWLYDMSHVIFNRDVVKIFGLGVPGLGPKGIAAGTFASDVPDKKHLRFFIYTLSLIFGGLFGLDSFMTGDNQSGLIRLVMLISIILTPIAIIWWLYNLFRFFVDTKSVINENYEFFGAPVSSLSDKMISWFPFLSAFINPIKSLRSFVDNVFSPVIQPIAQTAQMAISTVDKTVDFGKEALDKSAFIVEKISDTIDKTGKAVSMASSVVPGVSLYSSITPDSVKQELGTTAKMAGGAILLSSNLNILPYTLLGTLGIIAVSGFILTYYRSKQNVKPTQRDDSPPEPGIFREAH